MATAGENPMCNRPKNCFNISCGRAHTADICPSPDVCQDFHCPNRHSKQRTRCCNFGYTCHRPDCAFLHPRDRQVPVPAARAAAQAPNRAPQPAQAPASPGSKVIKVVGFGPHVSDLTMVGQKLQDALTEFSHHQVIVDIPNRANVQSTNAQAFAYFESCGAAQSAAQWINGAAASGLDLGALKAEVYSPAVSGTTPAQATASMPSQARVAGAPSGSMQNGPHRSASQPNDRARFPGPPPPPQDGNASVPGVAELRAMRHPALGQMWPNLERVLVQHQRKVTETQEELVKLADGSAHLRACDLREATEAIKRLLKELEQQRVVFLEYVGRCVRAQMNPEPTLAALAREVYRLEGALPALAVRKEFEAAIEAGQFVVVKGETGSGKSTQLPQYLVDMRCIQGKQVIVTQPRKVAAQELAKRVGLEFAAGDRRRAQQSRVVGFHVGGNRSFDPQQCRIKYMTEAVLLNEMLNNADLSRYGAIIIDEAHERSINTDVLLGLLKKDIHKYKDLKICVTSATIETEMFCNFFGQAGSLNIPGRMFPVVVKHMPIQDAQDLARPTVSAVLKILDETAAEHQPGGPAQQSRGGDVLVFLTGQVRLSSQLSKSLAPPG
ncbi:hypothetical protein ABBQ38_008205 [Trebouxia sp. C0009 RCD-2024]